MNLSVSKMTNKRPTKENYNQQQDKKNIKHALKHIEASWAQPLVAAWKVRDAKGQGHVTERVQPVVCDSDLENQDDSGSSRIYMESQGIAC